MKILVKHNIIRLHQRKWKRNLWSWSLGNMNLVSTEHILHILSKLFQSTEQNYFKTTQTMWSTYLVSFSKQTLLLYCAHSDCSQGIQQ